MTRSVRMLGVVLVLSVAAVTSGCARAGERLGGGPEVDLCTGWGELDGLDEPDLRDRTATVRWAEGAMRVIERIDVRRKIGTEDERVPTDVQRELDRAKEALASFVSELEDGASADAAFGSFTAGSFGPATRAVTTFTRSMC